MLQVIINADDFGLSLGVSQGIARAITEGVVTSTSIMGNMPDLAASLKLLQSAPEAGLGVHLTLSAGRPLLTASQVPSLVDKAGGFRRDSRLAVSKAETPEVEQEWRAQIERVLGFGIEPTHLDSHHHVHLAPRLMQLAVKLAKQYRIPCIRRLTVRDVWRESRPWRHALVLPHIAISQHLVLGSGLRFPRGVLSLHEQLLVTLSRLPEGIYEVFCHPGRVDDALFKVSSLRHERERELEFLVSPELKEGLRQRGIRLVTYREVAL
ncbi:MAG: Carbohydrate deacetylase [Firmicutes bacterium]|nr:Carbohydrate deacetylase [candidate division NPL-UPA2 bacterium]